MDAELVEQERCAIRDRDNRTIGWTREWRTNETTGEPSGVLVHLEPEVRQALGTRDETVFLDGGLILAIRRDEILLDRTTGELRQMLDSRGPVLAEVPR